MADKSTAETIAVVGAGIGGLYLIAELGTRDAGLPFPPRVEEVAAGGEVTITHRLSSPITFVDSASSPPRPRFVHIPQDVATIDCIIAADSTSPPPNEHLASHEPLP